MKSMSFWVSVWKKSNFLREPSILRFSSQFFTNSRFLTTNFCLFFRDFSEYFPVMSSNFSNCSDLFPASFELYNRKSEQLLKTTNIFHLGYTMHIPHVNIWPTGHQFIETFSIHSFLFTLSNLVDFHFNRCLVSTGIKVKQKNNSNNNKV